MYWRRLGPVFLALGICTSTAPPVWGQVEDRAEIVTMAEDQYGDLLRSSEHRSIREIVEQNLVYGQDGEEIGQVTDLVFGPEGQILSVVAEIDGIWETHVSIPWKEVVPNNPADGIAGILLPIEEEDELIPEFVLSPDDAAAEIREVGEPVAVAGGAWLATDLLGARARLEGADGPETFGQVQDAFMEDGDIFAVIVRPAPALQLPELLSVPLSGEAVEWNPDGPSLDFGHSFETLMEAPAANLDE